jgi:hypothetical protein
MLRARARAALTCWLLLCAAGPAPAQDLPLPPGPYVHAPSRLAFPEALGGLERVSAHDYESEQAGLGVSVKYIRQTPTVFADVYVFNARQAKIAPGIADPLVESMFKAAISDIYGAERAGRYRNVALLGQEEIALSDGPGAPHMLRARFAYVLDDAAVFSYVYGMAANDHFVKVRLTYRQDQSAEAQALLAPFLQALGGVVGQQQ